MKRLFMVLTLMLSATPLSADSVHADWHVPAIPSSHGEASYV